MRRAFFLDRDGVINKNRMDYVKKPEELVFLPGAAEAIHMINATDWLVVVITNQSMVGRGMATMEDLEAVHSAMLSELERSGARIDGLYCCPHAPDAGCECRKPEPGMLLQASRDLDIDLSASIMVGDLPTDIEVGQRAGTLRQELVTEDRSLLDIVKEVLGSGV